MGLGFVIMFYGDTFNEPTIVRSTIISLKFDTFNSSWNIKKLDSFPLFNNMKGCQDSAKSLCFKNLKRWFRLLKLLYTYWFKNYSHYPYGSFYLLSIHSLKKSLKCRIANLARYWSRNIGMIHTGSSNPVAAILAIISKDYDSVISQLDMTHPSIHCTERLYKWKSAWISYVKAILCFDIGVQISNAGPH